MSRNRSFSAVSESHDALHAGHLHVVHADSVGDYDLLEWDRHAAGQGKRRLPRHDCHADHVGLLDNLHRHSNSFYLLQGMSIYTGYAHVDHEFQTPSQDPGTHCWGKRVQQLKKT